MARASQERALAPTSGADTDLDIDEKQAEALAQGVREAMGAMELYRDIRNMESLTRLVRGRVSSDQIVAAVEVRSQAIQQRQELITTLETVSAFRFGLRARMLGS